MRILTTLATLAVAAIPLTANADVVYENPWNSAAVSGGPFSQPNQRFADEFVLSAAATVDAASWYGTMFALDPLDTGDTWTFDVLFYNDGPGNLPGTLLSSASLLAAVTDTGINVGGERAYLFSATFAGVALASGTSYWFSVVNTDTEVSDTGMTFRWTEATSGLDTALSPGGGPWVAFDFEPLTPLNFTLRGDRVVPEPATLALLGLGLFGLRARRWRR